MSDAPSAAAINVDDNTFGGASSTSPINRHPAAAPGNNNNNSSNNADLASQAKNGADADAAAAAAERRTLVRRAVTGAAVVILIYVFTSKGRSPTAVFDYHPSSMTIAFLGLMPEAISLAMQARAATSMNKRGETVQCHALVSAAFKLVALAGYVSIWKYKVERGKSHFTSWHGKLGLLAGLILLAQVALGVAQFWAVPGITSSLRVTCRKLHRVLGTGLALISAAAFASGFASNYAVATFLGQEPLRWLFGGSCLAAALWALWKE